MGRSAILLIGTEKTGTTTLQHFLAANREVLAARGFLYPSFCGSPNHTGLAAYALDPARRDPLRAPFGAHGEADVAPMRARLQAAAEAELKGGATAIFCSEHCHSRLTTLAEVETLRDFLRGFFDEIRIGVYLRRQDQVALSLYSTRLKSGEAERQILPRADGDDPFFNYDRSLALWEEAFGREAMHVRLFDRRTLTNGSVVDDFLATWELGPIQGFAPVADQNESITPVAQEYLRRLNPHLAPVGGLPVDEVRGPLAARLAALFPGRGARPARPDVEAFYAKYREFERAGAPALLPRPGAASSTRISPPTRRSRTRATPGPTTSRRSEPPCMRAPSPIRAASRPKSPSATGGCTGRATNPRPPSARCGGRSAGGRSMRRPIARSPNTSSGSTASARRSRPPCARQT